MKFFHKGKAPEEQPTPQKPGRRFSRRRFVIGAIAEAATLVAVDTVDPEQIAEAVLDASIRTRQPIPSSLQRPTIVQSGRKIVSVGLGDSNMAGQGDHGTPLVDHIAQDATAQGIPMTAISEAQNGTLSGAVRDQAARARVRIPSSVQHDIDVEIWTGENDIKADPTLIRALERLSHDPLDLGGWRTFFDRRKRIREALQRSLEQNVADAAEALGTKKVTLYGLSPVQYAQRIVDIDSATGKTTAIPMRDTRSRLKRKINQAVAASLIRQGTRAVINAAETLGNQGYDTTVIDSAAEVTESDFNTTGDQHFGPKAARRIARTRASLFRSRKK